LHLWWHINALTHIPPKTKETWTPNLNCVLEQQPFIPLC
jgi:hypothetical protein